MAVRPAEELRAIAFWCAKQATDRASISNEPYIDEVLRQVFAGGPPPTSDELFTWVGKYTNPSASNEPSDQPEITLVRINSNDDVDDNPYRSLTPQGVSKPHYAAPTLISAADPNALKAAVETLNNACATFSDDAPAFLQHFKDTFSFQSTTRSEEAGVVHLELPGTGFIGFMGVFSLNEPLQPGDRGLLTAVSQDKDFLLKYRANPSDPKWAHYFPPPDPELSFRIKNPATTLSVTLAIHEQQPATDLDNWYHVEQACFEFGVIPLRMLTVSWGPKQDRAVKPTLEQIPNGWNIVRVSIKNAGTQEETTSVQIDIWPTGTHTRRQLLKTAPPRPDVKAQNPATDDSLGLDARGHTVAFQTLPTPTPSQDRNSSIESKPQSYPSGASPSAPPASSGHGLPAGGSLLIRTDFTDDNAWTHLARAAQEPNPDDGFVADLVLVDDARWADITVDGFIEAIGEPPPYYAFFADHKTFTHPEHPILAVCTADSGFGNDRGQTVRVVPAAMWSIENNLSISNMDFIDFVDGANADSIFRCF